MLTGKISEDITRPVGVQTANDTSFMRHSIEISNYDMRNTRAGESISYCD